MSYLTFEEGISSQNSCSHTQDRARAILRAWKESEWLLTHLRPDTGLKPRQITEQEILQWAQKLN